MLEATLGPGLYVEPWMGPMPHVDTRVRWDTVVTGMTADCIRNQKGYLSTTCRSASDVALGMTKRILTAARGGDRRFGTAWRLKDLPRLSGTPVAKKATDLWNKEHGDPWGITPVAVRGTMGGQDANMMFHWNAGGTKQVTRDVTPAVEHVLKWMATMWAIKTYEPIIGPEATSLLDTAGYDTVAPVLPMVPVPPADWEVNVEWLLGTTKGAETEPEPDLPGFEFL